MSEKRRRQLSVNRVEEDLEHMLTRELAYAAFQCGGFEITEDDIYEPLIYDERNAIAPLCRKLLPLVRRQQAAEAEAKGEAKESKKKKPIKRGNVLSSSVSGYLVQQLLERCALPPDLLRLTSVLLKADRFSVRNSNLEEWQLPRKRVLSMYRRYASLRSLAKAIGYTHPTVRKWLEEPGFDHVKKHFEQQRALRSKRR